MTDTSKFTTHPVADIFPMLSDSELRELADDIKVRGLLQPIVMHDGMVLDGRNRLLACRLAGVEPRFVTYSGDDPLGYVIALNLHRRHLTTGQRAIVADRAAKLPPFRPSISAQKKALTQPEAAEALSVSRTSVQSARAISSEPELVEQVWRGEIMACACRCLRAAGRAPTRPREARRGARRGITVRDGHEGSGTMRQREITAAGVFGDGTGERWVVIEYDDGSREAYASQWLDAADRVAILSDDRDVVREWLRRVKREGVADWTIEPDVIMAGRLLDGYEGIGLYGVGVGW